MRIIDCPCVTFLQEQQTSYAAAGLFKFAMWPYGIKLLWSPVVDSLYFSKCGRRKTWIVPLQLVVAAVLWHISQHLQQWLLSYDVPTLALWFGIIVLLSATQDIAVDGWALVVLSRRNLSHAASAQTIGLTAGYFVSYTLLLAFSSESFGAVISVPSYMRFLAVCFVVRPRL
jgi:PAT family acetyl-CoA transporter-like MFS transporter 1